MRSPSDFLRLAERYKCMCNFELAKDFTDAADALTACNAMARRCAIRRKLLERDYINLQREHINLTRDVVMFHASLQRLGAVAE